MARIKPKQQNDIIYNIWIPQDQTPYALTARAEKKGFKAGPNNVPPWIAELLPDKWWENTKEARKLLREKLGKKIRFALHYRYFKGQFVIRKGPTREYWDVYIGKIRFKCSENPFETETTALRDISGNIDHEGIVPVGTPDNPYKSLVGHDDILMTGSAEILEDSPMVFKAVLKIKDKEFVLFASRDNTSTDVWTVKVEEK